MQPVAKPKRRALVSSIKNKFKRAQVFAKQKAERKKEKKDAKQMRDQEEAALGSAAPPKPKPFTQDTLREWDDTVVDKDDPEIVADEASDEFADLFSGDRAPKMMLTTKVRPSGKIFDVLKELMTLFPSIYYYKRNNHPLKKICRWAAKKDFTHLVVVGEKAKKPNKMHIIKLPGGPTAYFKFTSWTSRKDIPGHGVPTGHDPEVILNRFDTRLGRRLSRMFGSMFPQKPEYHGRSVVTFHNQRDFVFVRHHRYIFESRDKARLQELGPRFTLKLKWLLADTFNTEEADYEWMHKGHSMDKTRRTFHL